MRSTKFPLQISNWQLRFKFAEDHTVLHVSQYLASSTSSPPSKTANTHTGKDYQ